MTTRPTESRRLCTTCFRLLDVREFRRQARGKPLLRRECNSCHAKAEQLRRLVSKDRRLQAHFRSIIKRRKDVNATIRLTETIVRDLGGLEAVAGLWVRHVRSSPPGSLRALRACQALCEMVCAADALRREPRQGANAACGAIYAASASAERENGLGVENACGRFQRR